MGDHALLVRITEEGWNEGLAARFELEFGADVRRLVILHIWKVGLVSFRVDPRRAYAVLNAQQLEIFENAISDLWIALTSGLLTRYVRLAPRIGDGPAFLQYLSPAIRNIVLDNARSLRLIPRETDKAMIQAFCRSKRSVTRKRRLAQMKYRMKDKVEEEILRSIPSEQFDAAYLGIHRLSDYLFEKYLPTQCHKICNIPGQSVLQALVEGFLMSGLHEALEYTGAITPWDPSAVSRVLRNPETARDEDEFLSMLMLNAGRTTC